MNNYVRKFFKAMFRSQQTQQIAHIQLQHSPPSPEEWRAHWQAKDFPWRTEAEISSERQEELKLRLQIVPDVEQGRYPFKELELSRADVEWLVAKYDDALNYKGKKLDLRGAKLCNVDLSELPLTGMLGGIGWYQGMLATSAQREAAAIHLEKADLTGAHLEEADLSYAYLEEAILKKAHLEKAILVDIHLKGANLEEACLVEAMLAGACLDEAQLIRADLKKAFCTAMHAENALFWYADLERADFWKAHLNEADFYHANLKRSNLFEAYFRGAKLDGAHLEDATLFSVYMEHSDLSNAHLERTDLHSAHLECACLNGAFFDSGTQLYGASLGNETLGYVSLADVRWGDLNLTVLNWSEIPMLGDERYARFLKQNGNNKQGQVEAYETAVRANRQLAVALENQGLNEDAARFALRACNLQRQLYWKRRNFLRYFGSAMLALLAGYGYRMWHILVAYLFIVSLCAVAYFVTGMHYEPHLTLLEAVLISITAFHGRVFSEPFLQPGEPQLWVTAFEAVAGLVIEGVFIAMLTQKFFGK